MTAPADEISTADAAKLIGVSAEMVRRLVNSGHIPRHARGRTTVSGAVAGYAAFLRTSAEQSEGNAAQVRSHRAKAAKIRRTTERRRANLMPVDEVEAIIEITAQTAIDRLRSINLAGEIDGRTIKAFAKEIDGACSRIEVAKASALAALSGGQGDGLDE